MSQYAKAAGPFTERLWAAAEEVITATEQHPFVVGLLEGTLPLESFQFYIRQDGLYLKEFGRGLAVLVGKSHHDRQAEHLLSSAKGTMLVETDMHDRWLKEWGDSNPYATHEKSPHNELYTSWLLKHTSLASFEVAMTAFCPCFWVYLHIGQYLLAKRNERGTECSVKYYEEWVQEYAGDGFRASVEEMLYLIEELGAAASPAVQTTMINTFVKGCKMEWMFWDMGLKKSHWPL